MADRDYYETFTKVDEGINTMQLTQFTQRYLVGRPFALGVGAQRETLNRLNITDEALRW
jgi:hypothetical protein